MTLLASDGLVLLPCDVDSDKALTSDQPQIAIAPSSGAPSWTRRYVAVLLALDLTAALIANLVCWLVRPIADRQGVTVLAWHVRYWMLTLVVTPIWLGALAAGGAYRRHHASQGLDDYRLPVVTALRLAGAASIIAFGLHIGLSRLLVVVYFPVLVVVSLLLRLACRQGLSALRRRGHALRRMLLVGDLPCVTRFANHLLRSPGYDLVGACVPDDASFVGRGEFSVAVVGRPDDAVTVAAQRGVDIVLIVGHPHLEKTTLQEMAWRIERSGRSLLVGPDVVDLAGPRISVAAIGGLPLLHIGDPLIGVHRQTIKAVYERLIGLVLLIVLGPLFAIVAL
ncbi:MAG: hypothetical protein M3256_08015, partial [Actinomycetota bacterium]|nr:hypothetical protein [Actinomycetota bacterium]